MKKLISIAVLAIIGISLFTVYSCKKHKFYRNHKGFESETNYPVAFVVNGESTSISLVDITTNTVKETLQLEGSTFPHHIYLNPDKSLMVIAFIGADLSGGHGGGHGSGKKFVVQVFNTKTGKHETNIFLKRTPHNAIFSPDGTELWIGQSGSESSIFVYDTKKWKMKSEIHINKNELSEVTFSADGTKAYAANTGSGTVSIINVSDKSISTTIDVGADPVGAWTGTNGKMYVDNETSKTITEIDVASNTISSTINLGFKPGYVALNDATNELWVSDAENGRLAYFTQVAQIWTLQGSIPTGSDAHAIAFNSAKTLGYITNQGAQTVSVINTTTHQVVATISVGQKPNGIAIIE